MWRSVDNERDLLSLKSWSGMDMTGLMSVYGGYFDRSYSPQDVAVSLPPEAAWIESCQRYKNIHLLYAIDESKFDAPTRFVELALLQCSRCNLEWLEQLGVYLSGTVDPLRRFELRQELESSVPSVILRCSRLLYREVEAKLAEDGDYFMKAVKP